MNNHTISNNTISTDIQIDNKYDNTSTKINSCSVQVAEPSQQLILSSSSIDKICTTLQKGLLEPNKNVILKSIPNCWW